MRDYMEMPTMHWLSSIGWDPSDGAVHEELSYCEGI